MKKLLLLLLSCLWLSVGSAWAFNPYKPVPYQTVAGNTDYNHVVASGQTTTFDAAPNRGTGATTTYNNYYYASIEIKSGGVGVFSSGQNVQQLLVRTGGTVRFGAAGEVSSVYDEYTSSAIVLEPGAIVELANPRGLPFAQGYYNGNNYDPSSVTYGNASYAKLLIGSSYVFSGLDAAYYTFNGSAAQSTAAPADATRGGGSVATSSGVALTGTARRLTLRNAGGMTLNNDVSISQELHLANGIMRVGTGGSLTLLSTSAGTALIDNTGSGRLSGTITMQRYIDGTRNPNAGYRHLAAPLDGQTVASFATSSFTPTINPAYNTNPATVPVASFPTVFSYDESKVGGSVGTVGFNQGWQSPGALTTSVSFLDGYTVNMPAQGTISFRGIYANLASTGADYTRQSAAAGGWFLIGNPYAAPLDWDKISNKVSGFNKTLYVFKSSGKYAGTYTTYLPGAPASANTGTNVIPAAQAFFVYNPTPGSTATMATSYTDQITSYDLGGTTPVQRPTAETRPYLTLLLQDAAATQASQTLVYFDAAATPGLDNAFDSPFMPGATQAVSLTTELAGQQYATNGLPALSTADVTVPLRLSATTAGSYQLQVAELQNLPAGTRAYLLDATANTRQEMTATTSVSLTLPAATPVASRYSVVFSQSAPLATAPASLAALVSLYPNPASGTATLRLPAALRAGQPTTVRVFDALGRPVRTATQPAAADELTLSLDGLAPGLYTVQAQAAGGTVVRRLTVQ